MPQTIRLLDDLTINKIAAGEVVQDPASVVKELVENSLDAEASEITVEIGAGGRHLIRVTDNGIGMGRDDALLSLERHATSKIRTIEDLSDLSSLGFRGEAIPSIASISRFSILTSDGKEATFIRVEGGRILACEKAARSQGTTIEVGDLFFNVPVRKKFLKSPASDELAITRKFSELGLAYPQVKFKLMINKRLVLSLVPESPEERIRSALGPAFKDDLIPLNYMNLRGYIGLAQKGRPNRSSQYLFLNGRAIRSTFFSWAVKEGYSTHLPERRFPLFVLWLSLPSADIDVNIHPQKLEARFRDERGLQEMVYKGVREALYHASPKLPPKMSLEMAQAPKWDFPTVEISPHEEFLLPIPEVKQEEGRVIAALKGYLLAEVAGKEGVLLIDQERAHARVLFEQLLRKKEKSFEQEALLIPRTFGLPKPDAQLLKQHLDSLNALGFEIREFGVDTFALEAYPSAYGTVEIEGLIQEFLEVMRRSNQSETLFQKLSEKSASFSFRKSRVLTLAEGQRLLDDLLMCDDPMISPSGKPVRVHLDGAALAKHF